MINPTVHEEILSWPKSSLGFFLYNGSCSAQLSLTSFKTILLHCIVTAVISACVLKKHLSKLVNFCVAILILKMEENIQHFWHIMLYYFKEGKNATEKKDLCRVWRRCYD